MTNFYDTLSDLREHQRKFRHSEFWLNKRYFEPDKFSRIEYLMALTKIRRAIANFVTIATGKSIPVLFSSGKQSYATQQHIVIRATADPEYFDSNVSLALHEASHLLWTTANPDEPESVPLLSNLSKFTTQHISQELQEAAETQHDDLRQISKRLHAIINIIEDHRVDTLMWERAPGYRPYYDAFYAQHFYTENVNTLLQHPISRYPSVDNYFFHLCNITNKYADPDALPRLREIWQLVNVADIKRFGPRDPAWKEVVWKDDTLPEIVRVAHQILCIIYQEAKSSPSIGDIENFLKEYFERRQPNNTGLPNLDIPDAFEMLSLTQKLGAEVKRLLKEHMGDHDTGPGSNDQQVVDALVKGQAQLRHIQGHEGIPDVHAVIYRTVDLGLTSLVKMVRGSFQWGAEELINRGVQLGKSLVHKLRFIQDERDLVFPHKRSGKIHKRSLAQLGTGVDNVFYHMAVDAESPVHVHLSIDGSSSMAGSKWNNAVVLAIAMAKCAEQLKHLSLTISLRDCARGSVIAENLNKSEVLIHILFVWDSRKDSFSELLERVKHIGPGEGTPEGLAFEAMLPEILNQNSKAKQYFINISDGMPYINTNKSTQPIYYGKIAWEHTARQIRRMEREGITVLSYFVGTDEDTNGEESAEHAFRIMYGKNAAFVAPDSITGIANSLNRMFTRTNTGGCNY